MLTQLERSILAKEARLGVVGLGYVGLPVACSFAASGYDVVGIELRPERVAQINAGICPIQGHEPGLAELLAEVVAAGRLRASTDASDLGDRDVILVNVETPVDEEHVPQYHALRGALASVGRAMRRGALVIVESTIAPGTMRDVALPLLQQASGLTVNEGFFLGHCPERVMPGRLLQNLRSVSRTVGGMTPETARAMVALYRQIVAADLDPTDCLTAELVKTVENAYRDVNIAFANEVALICEAIGGDVWKVRDLVNKSPGRNMLLPGAGVGGHCIPKDPWLLVHAARGKDVPVRLVPAARAVNDGMPHHVTDMVVEALAEAGLAVAGARIAVLGYAYLENSDDTRNTPSEPLVRQLRALGADVVIHDPHVSEYAGPLDDVLRRADAVVLMVRHDAYQVLALAPRSGPGNRPVIVDARNMGLGVGASFSRIIGRGAGVTPTAGDRA